MVAKLLTLAEIQKRRQQLSHEADQDAQAIQSGRLDADTAIRRNVYREAEQRWLEMELLFLEQSL